MYPARNHHPPTRASREEWLERRDMPESMEVAGYPLCIHSASCCRLEFRDAVRPTQRSARVARNTRLGSCGVDPQLAQEGGAWVAGADCGRNEGRSCPERREARFSAIQRTAGLEGVSTTFPGMAPAIFSAQRRGPSESEPTLPTTGRRASVSMRRASSESWSRFGSTTKKTQFTSARSARVTRRRRPTSRPVEALATSGGRPPHR